MNEIVKSVQASDFQNRFWPKVNKTSTCWNWTASMDKWGYGYIYLAKRKVLKAPRASWMIANGEITGGLHVLHFCDNPSCVNPDHLFLGTNLQNMQDKMRKGRWRGGDPLLISGERHGRSKLKQEDVVFIRDAHAAGDWTYKALAKKFNVSFQQIGSIVTRKAWRLT